MAWATTETGTVDSVGLSQKVVGRDQAIQWLRALAAIEVMAWHSDLLTKEISQSSIQLSAYAPLGGIGVEIFFVVSGFLMSLVTRQNPDARSFAIDRARRILPLYWAFTGLVIVAFLVNPNWHLGDFSLDFSQLAKSFLLLPQEGFPILMVGWTLEYEVLFYALVTSFAALALLRRSVARIGLGLLLATFGLIGAMSSSVGGSVWLDHLFSPYMFAFGFGWLLHETQGATGTERAFAACGFGIPLLAAFLVAGGHDLELLIRISIAAALVGAILPLRRLGAAGGSAGRAIAAVGEASYSIYLSHWFVLSIIGKLAGAVAVPASASLALRIGGCVVAVGVGTALYRWIERPLDAALRRLTARMKPRPQGHAPASRPLVNPPHSPEGREVPDMSIRTSGAEMRSQLSFALPPLRVRPREDAPCAVAIVTDISLLKSCWEDLRARATAPAPYQSYEWCASWIEACRSAGRPEDARIVTVREEGRLVLLWPLALRRLGPVRILHALGEPATQYCDFLVEPSPRASLWVDTAWSRIVDDGTVDLVHLRHVRADGMLERAGMERGPRTILARAEAPVLKMARTEDGAGRERLRGGRSINALKRHLKHLKAHGDVIFETVPAAGHGAAVDEALALKAEWLRARGEASAGYGHPANDAAIMAMALGGHFSIFRLTAGGQTAAVEIGLVDRGRYHSLIQSYDSRFAAHAPGRLLLWHLLETRALGAETLDFLPPSRPHKTEWTDDFVAVTDYAVPLTWRGRAAALYLRSGRTALKRLYSSLPRSARTLLSPLSALFY